MGHAVLAVRGARGAGELAFGKGRQVALKGLAGKHTLVSVEWEET